MSHCTYKTSNINGYFYIGRAVEKKVLAGLYTGSGVFYTEFRKLNPNGWTTEVLKGNLTLEEAKAHEVELVNIDLIKDPMCLNIRAMGKGQRGDIGFKYRLFQELCPEYHKSLAILKAYEYSAAFHEEAIDGPQLLESFEQSNRLLRNAHQPYACYYIPHLDDGLPYIPREPTEARKQKRAEHKAVMDEFMVFYEEMLKESDPELYNATPVERIKINAARRKAKGF